MHSSVDFKNIHNVAQLSTTNSTTNHPKETPYSVLIFHSFLQPPTTNLLFVSIQCLLL